MQCLLEMLFLATVLFFFFKKTEGMKLCFKLINRAADRYKKVETTYNTTSNLNTQR